MDGFWVTDLLTESGASCHLPALLPGRSPPRPSLTLAYKRAQATWGGDSCDCSLDLHKLLQSVITRAPPAPQRCNHTPSPCSGCIQQPSFGWLTLVPGRHNLDLWHERPHSHSTMKILVQPPGLRGDTSQGLTGLNFRSVSAASNQN